jgi:signal transduction histidine kinase
MKKIPFIMDWGIFILRSYNYIVLMLQIFLKSGYSNQQLFGNTIWLLAAFIIPILGWFPQLRRNKSWFSLSELLFGGSLFAYSIIHMHQVASVSYLIPSLAIGYLLTRRTVWIIPIIVLLPATGLLFGEVPWNLVIGSSTDNLLFLFIGIWVRFITKAYHDKHALAQEINEQNRLLTQYASEIERMTLLEERNRMSKELHDTLGHSFISLIMGLDAAIALMNSKPDLVKKKLMDLRVLTEDNLNEMRDIVHEIGEEEEVNLIIQTRALITKLQHHTGVNIRFAVKGAERDVSFEIRQTVIRVIQESFTNALKHGKATEIELILHFTATDLQLIIRNNGRPIDKNASGFGLTSMKNRIGSLSGSFSIDSVMNAWTEVRCVIPYKEVESNV